MRVEKWGDSLALRLPDSLVQVLALKEGDEITIHIAGERVFDIEKKAGKAELLARLRALRGTIPSDFGFDRLEANER